MNLAHDDILIWYPMNNDLAKPELTEKEWSAFWKSLTYYNQNGSCIYCQKSNFESRHEVFLHCYGRCGVRHTSRRKWG